MRHLNLSDRQDGLLLSLDRTGPGWHRLADLHYTNSDIRLSSAIEIKGLLVLALVNRRHIGGGWEYRLSDKGAVHVAFLKGAS